MMMMMMMMIAICLWDWNCGSCIVIKMFQQLLISTVFKTLWLDHLRCMVDLFSEIMILELLDLFEHFSAVFCFTKVTAS